MYKPCIEKIVLNLLSNAIKYTPPGGSIEIKLSVVPNQGSDLVQRLRIEITDTGTGISEELIENIFEPFYQGSQEAGKMKQGVGMGLALVKESSAPKGSSIKTMGGSAARALAITHRLPRQRQHLQMRAPRSRLLRDGSLCTLRLSLHLRVFPRV